MKIPWHLILPETRLQQMLIERLVILQKPFLITGVVLCVGVLIGQIIHIRVVHCRWIGAIQFFALVTSTIAALLALVCMKWSTKIVLTFRSIICLLIICYTFTSKKLQAKEDCLEQSKKHRHVYLIKQYVLNIYICMSIFLTPFADNYFVAFVLSSGFFAIEFTLMNEIHGDESQFSLVTVPMWLFLMFHSTYYLRHTLTKFFLMQTEAEKTRDALIQILDNLPDAVLMLESSQLSYCNQQADRFFEVQLSGFCS
jgi:hypothetical protein